MFFIYIILYIVFILFTLLFSICITRFMNVKIEYICTLLNAMDPHYSWYLWYIKLPQTVSEHCIIPLRRNLYNHIYCNYKSMREKQEQMIFTEMEITLISANAKIVAIFDFNKGSFVLD